MTQIILLNGPPGSGKDTIANELERIYPHVYHLKFAQPLRDFICHLLGMDESKLDEIKDIELPTLGGNTIRQAMIAYCENFLLPLMGESYLGEQMSHRINIIEQRRWREFADFAAIVISDCGFIREIQPLVNHWRMPSMLMVHLERKGHNYSKDSRNYVEFHGLPTKIIKNNGSIPALIDKVCRFTNINED